LRCDIGSFEVIRTSGDTLPPSIPTSLRAPSVTSNAVSLQWIASTDNVAVTGYTVYRNGSAVGNTGAASVTTFADVTAAPSTLYSYTVDAFDGSGNHSPRSAPLSVTTPAPAGIQGAQGEAVSTPTKVTTTTIPLTGAVHAGDLLVGWFGQYDSAGQVQVSDSINGAWARSSSTTFSNGAGDIALYYVQNAAASPFGVTVTIAASSATYLEGAASDYTGVAKVGALDQVAVAKGVSLAVDSGATGAVGAGELVVGGIITGGSPGTTTPGASQGLTFTMRAQTVSGSAGLEDVLASRAGTQDARATLTTATDWYAVAAVFHQYGSGDTQPPTTPTGLAATSVTANSATISWTASTDNVGVAGYTVYRNGSAIGTSGGGATTYTDSTVAPSTAYSYTVDAVDIAGNHSPKSTLLSITTPAPVPPAAQWVQGGIGATGSKALSTTITLPSAVRAGDLLVGWFGQYDSSGQVQVSDNINGAWTRTAASTKFGSGTGDIALFYVQNAAAAPAGLTVTVSASIATYLQGSAADYSNMALANTLDQFAVASGSGTAADSGPTGSAGVGELLFSGFMTGSLPGGVTANGGLVIHTRSASSSIADASVMVTTAGPQHAGWTLQNSADWYEVAAVFHTTAAIFPPSNLTATAASSTQVNLSWTPGSGPTSAFTVYRNGSPLATVPATSVSYIDSTVAPVTTYSYAVDAVDAGGNHSPKSSPVSVTTPQDTTPPAVPGGISATAVSFREIDVSWNASSDNVQVTGYTIYRNGAFLTTAGAGVTAWADTTVLGTTTYSYSVDAFDSAGNHSASSTSASATTPATPDPQPPTVPAGVAAQVGLVGEVDVTWTAATDNVGVTGYTIYRGGALLATVSGSTLAFADRTVAGLTTYSYTVDSFDAVGNHSAPSVAAAVTTPDWTPPTVPTGLAATVVSVDEIDLTWSVSTDNVGVTGYTVYQNGVAIGTTPAGTPSYASTGLSHGPTYTYAVDAYDAAGNHSAQSAPVSAHTPDDIAPTTPGGFAASVTSPTAVSVSWSASTDNVGVTGYEVYRDSVVVTTLAPTALSYQDTVASGSTHLYTVDALDAAGNHSANPPAISVTTPAADTTPPSVPAGLTATAGGSTQVGLAWNASTDNFAVTGYTVYRNGGVLTTLGASTLTYSDTSVAQATDYTYSVDAVDSSGNHSPQSATVSVHVPGVPKYVQSAVVTTGSAVTSMTLTLGAVASGDLLVGWFGQYNSTGQVTVSDSVNGVWTRSASTTWHGGTTPGDVALYYLANSAAAPSGLTITIASTTATYLQAGAAEYSGVAKVNPLDQVVVATGSSTSADSGLTAAVGPRELVFGGMTATTGPGTLTSGSSQGVAFLKRAQSSSGSQSLEDIVASAAGQQHAGFTFPTSTQWFVVCAVFKPA
jgi:chitodextrinase